MTEHIKRKDKGITSNRNIPVTENEISPTKVSEIKVIAISGGEYGLVAIASCVVDDKWFFGSLGLFYENGKYKLTYPTKKYRKSYMTVYNPINVPAGEAIFDAIVKEYENLISQGIG